MATKIQLRRGTAAQWTAANPTLWAGELGLETDTNQFKIGDGSTAWNSMQYASITSSYVLNQVNLAIANLIDSAPSTLNTLNEIAAAINDDANFFVTVANDLSNHQSDTTNIHGIANTADLATKTYADSAVSTHSSDTTSIHGISDTANLVYTNDSRLSNARTPVSHASSHGSAGSDPVTIAQSQVTNLTTDLGLKAPLNSPALTGTPTAPTASASTNTTQIATTEFVRTEISNLVNGAGPALDTLNELASALGNDASFATTVTTALSGKEPTITSGNVAQYWRGDKSWQTLNKSAVGLPDVENTALSTWAGSSNITTVGTLTNLTVTNTITGSITGNAGTVTNGVYTSSSYSDPSWITSLSETKVLPSQSTHNGKYLKTDGTSTSWGTIDFSPYATLASPALTGTPTAPTATSGTNTTQIATTEFVKTEVSNLINGAGPAFDTLIELQNALGNDANFSTTVTNSLASKAPLSSPALTGTPTSTTASVDTNTTQIATTAFVVGQASNTNPLMDGSVSVGTSLRYAREDHVHATDTSRAPLASPSFTGTVTAQGITVTGTLDVQEIREAINDVTLSSNVGTLDWTTGNIFFIPTAPTGAMTFNITNVPTDNNEIMTVTVFVTQGSTGYIPSTLNINGSAATIRWVNGSNPVPTSQAGKIDIFVFSLIRRASAWTVLGSSSLNF